MLPPVRTIWEGEASGGAVDLAARRGGGGQWMGIDGLLGLQNSLLAFGRWCPQRRRVPAAFLGRHPLVAGRVLNLTGRRSCFDWFGRIVCREPLNFRGQGFVAPGKWAKNGSSHW